METNKKQDYGNQVITHSKNKGTRRFSWNFLLIFYVIGVFAMLYILFFPIVEEINLWTYFYILWDFSLKEAIVECFIAEKFHLYLKIFLGCICFKAISLSIWLGHNI